LHDLKVMQGGAISNLQNSERHVVFQRFLRQIRINVGLTQGILATRLGQAQLIISRSELGLRKVDIIELRDCLRAMNVPFLEWMAELDAKLKPLETDDIAADGLRLPPSGPPQPDRERGRRFPKK